MASRHQFPNQCWDPPYVYAGPGNDSAFNQLQFQCPNIVADIPVCQSQYKKNIILGWGLETYGLTEVANGTAFADFIWGAFGPQTKEWLKAGLPRPLMGLIMHRSRLMALTLISSSLSQVRAHLSHQLTGSPQTTDNQAGYIALIKRLRGHIRGASEDYLITGTPQCVVPDLKMGQMITHAKFDIIQVQYYNTLQCSASSWVTANPNYINTSFEQSRGFNFDAW
jgi:chitinase